VTLSIGGNDLGFEPILRLCLKHALCSTLAQVRQLVAAGYERIRAVHTALDEIHARAPRARILLVEYPNFFPVIGTCHYASGVLGRVVTLDRDNVRFLHDRIDTADNVLDAQAYENGHPIPNVTVVTPGTAWSGHDVCSGDSWFVKPNLRQLLAGNSGYFFHPTAAGQKALFERILKVVQSS
jgi:hypothetical protein